MAEVWRVEWVDSTLMENRWRDDDDMDGVGIIISVGFRVKQADGVLYLAANHNPQEGHLHWSAVTAIPLRAIVKREVISGSR